MRKCVFFAPTLLARGVRSVAMGIPASSAEICAAAKLPPSHKELMTPIDANWTAINLVNRKRLQPLASKYAGEALTTIKDAVAEAQAKAPKPVKGAKQAFKTGKFDTVVALVTRYEEVMAPIRRMAAEIEIIQLEVYGLKDHIKLGLSIFKADQIEAKKKLLAETQKDLAAKTAAFEAQIADSFDTEIFNDIVNTLRIAGETQPEAREMAERVLEDMTLCNVAFDECTKLLLKNVIFGDGPYEDSSLLFTFVEYPERGEVSLSKAPLEKIADEAMRTISKRHQTPVTEGKLIRSPESHPNLQRSVE